ncbi:fatty acid desaturase [Paraburkholderia unamae]|uniref:Fatty acid desaturase n=1 Tax=Paraburkholderia unamae TaxID=219649 RepID=A0ABX5KBE3_9BURK|nr:fatty acid desaturase [Paraburkholderia unamae]PVX70890.1 fatty acid desaturase [Paraburkholderia unamae]
MFKRRILRNSRADLLCVCVIPFQISFYVILAFEFYRLSWPILLLLIPILNALSLQNSGANHNHYHTPFFHARWLNALVRMGFSTTGAPKTPYNIGHGLHHAADESWNDRSILEMLGLKRKLHTQFLSLVLFFPESFGIKYVIFLVLLKRWDPARLAVLVSPKEPELAERVLTRLRQPNVLAAAKLDLAAWLTFRLVLLAIDWRFFVFYFIPVTYLNDTLRQAENFFQHWGASDPNDRARDAVSCYGRLYNFLTFNLGYHQEHHFRPGAHWRELPRIASQLPTDRRIVAFSHYTNVPLLFPGVAVQLQERRSSTPPSSPAMDETYSRDH